MNQELRALTEAGVRMVELAETHAADFATRADEHDRENTFVAENFAAMKHSGFLASTAPTEHGGLGVESVHDITVAIARLARGCPASAICANMHIGSVWIVTRGWREAVRSGNDEIARQMAGFLPFLGRSQVVISGAGTESGNSVMFPSTEATKVDGGYLVNGHKIFATNSEIADSVTVILRIPDGNGWYLSGTAIVLRGAEGMEVKGNWDALGMRGSGSHDVVFTDCFVPDAMMMVGQPIGTPSAAFFPGLLALNYALVGAFLGIAEAARDLIAERAVTKKKKPFDTLLAERPFTQIQMAEIEVDLCAARATLSRTAQAMDAYFERPDSELTMDDLHELMKEFQCTKLVVNRAAADAVDRALSLSGGLGYLSANRLSRLYRDVRAGPFMQPFSPNEAFEFIGRVSLGLDPNAEFHALVAERQAAPTG